MAADEKVFSGRLKLKNLQIQSLQSLTDCSKRLRIADRSCHELALDSAVLVMSTRVRRQVSRLLRPLSQIVKKITVRCELPGRYVGMSANMSDRALLKTRA